MEQAMSAAENMIRLANAGDPEAQKAIINLLKRRADRIEAIKKGN
jgi:hypothetical protein